VELAGPPPHYAPKELTAPSGNVVLSLRNTSLATHNMAIGPGPLTYKGDRVTNNPIAVTASVVKGATATFRVAGLLPGAYAFWCTIGDHAALGMRGTLTVKR
jgi:plastocyanin